MAASFQICIDCANPDRLARFWASALGYVLEPPPDGYASWDDYWREVGVPEEDLGIGADSIIDPDGRGPRIMFHIVPAGKTVKNRLHFDIRASSGRATPVESRKAAHRRGGQPPGRPRRHDHAGPVRGGARSLRGRDDRPGGQRVDIN